MLGDEQKVQAILEDLEAASIPEAERVLFRFLEKVNREPEHIRQEDVEAVKAAGWTEEAIYDAITVCALFNFYNRWADATGVREHPPRSTSAAPSGSPRGAMSPPRRREERKKGP